MKNIRKRWLINPSLQLKFCAFFSVCALLNFFIFILASNWYFSEINQEMIKNGISETNPIHQFVLFQQSSLNVFFVGVSSFGLILMFFLGVWFSHKVAGPIHRLTEEIKNLDITQPEKIIEFRDGDYFLELRDVINQHLITKKKMSETNKVEGNDAA